MPPREVRLGTNFPINLFVGFDGEEKTSKNTLPLGERIGIVTAGQGQLDFMRMLIPELEIPNPIWKPGETRVFSPSNSTPLSASGDVFDLDPGYDQNSGALFTKLSTQPKNSLHMAWEINATDLTFGFDEYVDRSNYFLVPAETFATALNQDQLVAFAGADIVSGDGQNRSLSTLGKPGDTDIPFFSFEIRHKLFSDSNYSPLGYSQHKYFHYAPAMINNDVGLDTSVYEVVFEEITGDLAPELISPIQVSDGRSSNFIGNSNLPEDGLPNMTVSEVPTKPLKSILELSHFDFAFNNVNPPRVANALGNSSASYLIDSDAISQGDSLDHSYITNHLILDDWFTSSIAPRLRDDNSGVLKNQNDLFKDFLEGTDDLPNKCYEPSKYSSSAIASDLDLLTSQDGWKNIASRLVVNGAFNINSTSVEAWSALLKSQKNTLVPFVDDDLANGTATLDNI